MNHERFRHKFEEMGFTVSVDNEPVNEHDKGVLLAENDNGDKIYWCIIDQSETWGIYVDPDRFTLDDATFEWDQVRVDGDTLVFKSATGTRAKQTGYGRAGFSGTLTIDPRGSEVTEVHTY